MQGLSLDLLPLKVGTGIIEIKKYTTLVQLSNKKLWSFRRGRFW
jgi:hypothetical protein